MDYSKVLAVLGMNGTPTMTQGQLNTISQAQAAPKAAASKATVPSGYMAAGRAAGSNPVGGVAVGPTSGGQPQTPVAPPPKAGSGLIQMENGVMPDGTKTNKRKVSYIGGSGDKQTGTVTVTPGRTPDWYKNQQQLYKQLYNDQVAANNAALAETQKQAEAETAAQIEALGKQYQSTNRQLYRDMMEQRRTLPQQLAALGYSGGLTESSLLRMHNSYEEGLNDNERARLAQETGYRQALARQIFEARTKTNEANQNAREQLYARQAAIREGAWKNQQQRAATMAAAGDFSEHKRLGFSDSEIKYLKQVWNRTHPGLA